MRTYEYRTTEGRDGFINADHAEERDGMLFFYVGGETSMIFAPGSWRTVMVQPAVAEIDADRPDDGA